MGFKIGVCGAGSFARSFIPLFKAHPLIGEVSIAEMVPERRREKAEEFGIEKTYADMNELCDSDVDAVAIMTQRWTHAPLALQALKAGKHVYSAVPAGVTLEELDELVKTVEETGLTYMLGETSYYYPECIYCRERFHKGDFGKFVYAEGEYCHDMSHGFYEVYQRDGKEWKSHASFPPMLYPTHSVSIILAVTGARMTRVSCLGWTDSHEDGIFREDVSMWGNVFSNETALFRSSDGGMCRINEFRRVSLSGVRLNLLGTKASYEEQTGSKVWVDLSRERTDLTELLTCAPNVARAAEVEPGMHEVLKEDFYSGVSKVHPVERLPKEFRGLRNGHLGSHQFLVDDFAKAVATGKLPPNHVWAAAKYCAPGIVAHESAKRDSALMDVPDYGGPPGGAAFLED